MSRFVETAEAARSMVWRTIPRFHACHAIGPAPRAMDGGTSFLLTEGETRAVLARAGLTPGVWRDVTADAAAWLNQPPPGVARGVSLATVLGPRFGEMAANLARNVREGRVRLIMGRCDAAGA